MADNTSKVLEAMVKIGEPARAGDLAAATGLDKAEVSKAMKILKAEGKIHSPKRCCWAPVD